MLRWVVALPSFSIMIAQATQIQQRSVPDHRWRRTEWKIYRGKVKLLSPDGHFEIHSKTLHAWKGMANFPRHSHFIQSISWDFRTARLTFFLNSSCLSLQSFCSRNNKAGEQPFFKQAFQLLLEQYLHAAKQQSKWWCTWIYKCCNVNVRNRRFVYSSMGAQTRVCPNHWKPRTIPLPILSASKTLTNRWR
jgi:hypothetical protein